MNGVKITLTAGGNVHFGKKCSVTNEDYSVVITIPKYVMWREKKYLIQNVFPDLTAEEREFLISGWTPAEWGEKIEEPGVCNYCGNEPTTCLCDMD